MVNLSLRYIPKLNSTVNREPYGSVLITVNRTAPHGLVGHPYDPVGHPYGRTSGLRGHGEPYGSRLTVISMDPYDSA
uniref:Uncharacterized protein n=1 Tax=Acrobeloides nanus TaxID=290746 RepID=A0A914CP47_9BILA